MLVPGINEAVTPVSADLARSVDRQSDSGQQSFSSALAGASDAIRNNSANDSRGSGKVPTAPPAAQPTPAAAPRANSPSATDSTSSLGSLVPRGVVRASKAAAPALPVDSFAAPPKEKPAPSGPVTAIANNPNVAATALSSSPVAPLPTSPAPAPLPAPALPNSSPEDLAVIAPVGADWKEAPTPATTGANDAGNSVITPGKTVRAAGEAAAAEVSPSADVPELPNAPNQTPQAPPTDDAGDEATLPQAPPIAATLTQPDLPEASAQSASPHHTSAPQPAAAMSTAPPTSYAGSSAPRPSPPADAGAGSTATTTFVAQKHEFVTAALREVSSSVASVVQAPFTSPAAPALSKTLAPADPIAASATGGIVSANSQSGSVGGNGAGTSGQSSSGHAQSGGSSSGDSFSGHASADAPPQVQPTIDPASLGASASRLDSSAAQHGANPDSSALPGEKTSTISDLAESSQDPTSPASAPTAASPLAGPQVSQAHLLGDSACAEMRISVSTEALGPIELRATSDKDRIGAVIAAAKSETQELLANELPALHQALSERNLQVQQLTVSQGSLAGGGTFGRNGYSQNPEAWHKQAAANYWQPASESTASTDEFPGAVVLPAAPGQLSVHA